MKFKKRIIIIFVSITAFIILSGVVFAAFIFQRTSTGSAGVGTIAIESQGFVNYQGSYSGTDERGDYFRKDTVAIIDRITLSYTSSYEVASGKYLADKNYYTDSAGTTPAVYNVGDAIMGTVYVETKTYTGVQTADDAYFLVDGDIETSEVSVNNKTLTFVKNENTYTITVTISSSGTLATATASATGMTLRAVIGTSGLDLTILDSNVSSTDVIQSSSIRCNGTKNKYAAEDTTNDYPYLNQIGLTFSFCSTQAAYVRIHIKDAWIRTRVYSSVTIENYILKDQIQGVSPFTVSDSNWFYDSTTNTVYLREMYDPTQNAEGPQALQSYTFNVNPAYFYTDQSTNTYQEYVQVEVSFSVDVVQANRAKKLWGFDPSTYIPE